MKNIIQGWSTTIIGVILSLSALGDFLGFVTVPAPEGLTKWHQIIIAFAVGLALILLPPSFIEETLKKIIGKGSDKVC